MVKICKSWEQQVVDNAEAITALQEGVGADISELEGQVSELNQQMARTLKIPVSPPYGTKIVAVNGSGDQEMLNIGIGLTNNDGVLEATGSEGGGGWTKDTYTIFDLSETFYFSGVTDLEAPIIIGMETSDGYFTATLTNNAQMSTPAAYSTLFYAFGTVCCIKSEDGACTIIDASTGQTPPNSGVEVTIDCWYQ